MRSFLSSTPAFAAGLVVATGALADPSFNCAAAGTTDEKAICADPVLSTIDSIVAEAFAAFQPAHRSKTQVARDLLKDRAGCGGDRACIAAVLSGSLFTFAYDNSENHPPAAWVETYATALMGHKATLFARRGGGSALPARPGDCARTRVETITTRFGEPIDYENADAGTAIAFDNGLHQVSYGRGDEFFEVAAGDDAIVCLLSIPRDCPAGDERGRFYYTLDLKTQTQWVLADSQHLCGGA